MPAVIECPRQITACEPRVPISKPLSNEKPMNTQLSTNYGGLELVSPVIVGACPLTAQESMRLAIASAGAGAIVLPSLFQEEVLRWSKKIGVPLNEYDSELARRLDTSPADVAFTDPDAYLRLVEQACGQSPIPVIASLNGFAASHWVDIAGKLQQAGAAAIELQIHRDPPGCYRDPREMEDSIVEAVQLLDQAVSVPVFVKLGREYTSVSHLAVRLLCGAQGMLLYGRVPDTDITLDELKLRTLWQLTPPGSVTQILSSLMRVHAYCPAMSLAASGGISSSSDVIKVLLAGADAAVIASAVYREGPNVIRTYLDGLRVFLQRHQIASVRELREKRPVEFSDEQQRRDYREAISSRLSGESTRDNPPTITGDRYGHPA